MPATSPDPRIALATARCLGQKDADSEATQAALAELATLLSPEPQERMAQCVAALHAANAVLSAEYHELARIFDAQGQPVVCAAGCTGCCQQLVLCQPFEAENIRLYLEEHPQKLHAFRAAYALWDAATAPFRASYLRWAEGLYARGHDDGSHQLSDFTAPCPFLQDDGQGRSLCSIYEARPYGCRTCIALDPACATPAQHGSMQQQFTMFTGHHARRTALNNVLLARLGGQSKLTPLPDAVAALL